MKQFTNPYAGSEKDTLATLVIRISPDDYNFIKCIRPQQGTLSITVTLLWHKLCNELRLRNITDVSSSEQFEQFITNCRLVDGPDASRLPNGSTQGIVTKALGSDVGTGVAGLRPTSSPDEAVIPNVQVRDRKARGITRNPNNQADKG